MPEEPASTQEALSEHFLITRNASRVLLLGCYAEVREPLEVLQLFSRSCILILKRSSLRSVTSISPVVDEVLMKEFNT